MYFLISILHVLSHVLRAVIALQINSSMYTIHANVWERAHSNLRDHGGRAPSLYPKRRLSVKSRKVSKPRDWYFKLPYRFEIWQAHRQHCCRSACQISERSDNSKYKSRGFETLRDLTERRLFGYWDGPCKSVSVRCIKYILWPYTRCIAYSIPQEICTRLCCALLCCGYAIVHNEFTWSIYPYSSGLLCWHWGNR